MFKKYTLDNGLRVLLEENNIVNSISIGILFKVGSEREIGKNLGISHFIEHMLFKGTKTRTAKDITNEIDYIGGEFNAYTTKDHTAFYVHIPSKHLEIGIDVLSDIILNSVFSREDIEKEKSVVIEEINMYNDSPEDYVYENLARKTYGNFGIGHDVLGNKESVQRFTREEIIKYFKTYYVPDNAVISISGRFNSSHILDLVAQKFSKFHGVINGKDVVEVKNDFSKALYAENKTNEQIQLSMIIDRPLPKNIKEYFISEIITNYIAATPSSVLFQRLREEKALVYAVGISENEYSNRSEYELSASFSKDNTEEVLKIIYDEINNLKKNYIDEGLLEILKEQLKGYYFLDLEDTGCRMIWSAKLMLRKNIMLSEEEIQDIIDSISINEVIDIIDSSFDYNFISLALVGQDIEDVKIDFGLLNP